MQKLQFSLLLTLSMFFQIHIYAQEESKYEIALEEYRLYEEEHGGYITTKNIKMHYLSWGDIDNPTIIWIHGTRSDAYELLQFVDTIVNSGFHLVAIDYYGHGKTGYPDKEVSIYHVADDINSLMEELKIEKAIIGGWSRGGTIASAFYDSYPDKTISLILLAGGFVNWLTTIYSKDWDFIERVTKERFMKYPPPEFYSSEEEAFNNVYDPKKGDSQFYKLNSINRSSKNNLWGYYPHLFEFLSSSNADEALMTYRKPSKASLFQYSTANFEPRIVFRNLDKEVLVMDSYREQDWQYDFREANDKMTEEHSDWITYKLYEDTYHAIHWMRPKEFTTELLQFISRFKK